MISSISLTNYNAMLLRAVNFVSFGTIYPRSLWSYAPFGYIHTKKEARQFVVLLFGDPYRIRTDVKGVRGLCLNHLTNGPRALYKSANALYTWSAFGDSNPGPTD